MYNILYITITVTWLAVVVSKCYAKQYQQQQAYSNIIFQFSSKENEQANTWCSVRDGRTLEEIKDLDPFQSVKCDAGGEAVYCIIEDMEEETEKVCALVKELCQKAKGTILPTITGVCSPKKD